MQSQISSPREAEKGRAPRVRGTFPMHLEFIESVRDSGILPGVATGLPVVQRSC